MTSRLAALLVTLLATLNFSVRNLPWHLDDHDQAKQAYRSREIINQWHCWHQHTPQEHVATKAPLAVSRPCTEHC